MNRCLTPRQQELVDLAGTLAGTFAERAAAHDRDNTFPVANYADLRAAGFLRLTVPTELGGQGATLADLVPVLERLAMGDGSTALAVAMHISPIGQWASVWQRTGNPRLADLLRQAAQDKLIWASVTSEPGMRNPPSTLVATVVMPDRAEPTRRDHPPDLGHDGHACHAKQRRHLPDPLVQDTIGECEILVESARALAYRHAEEVGSRRLFELGVQEGIARCALVKYVASNNATLVLQRLVDVLGGASYTRALPFERMWRDAQAGRFMPMSNQAARRIIGASSLGVALAPVIGFDETGPDSRAKT